jgi:hypothetical protein
MIMHPRFQKVWADDTAGVGRRQLARLALAGEHTERSFTGEDAERTPGS